MTPTGGDPPSGDESHAEELAHEMRDAEPQEHAPTRSAILDALPGNVALLDDNGVVREINGAWRRFGAANGSTEPSFGLDRDYLEVCQQARGETATGATEVAAGLRAVLRGSAPEFSLDYPCHSATEKRWYRVLVTPLRGAPRAGAMVVHLDVTEEKRSEQRLREQAALLDAAGDAIVVKDMDDHVLYWSLGAKRAYGWRAEEALGRPAAELLHGDAERYAAAWNSVLEHGFWRGDLAHRDREGRQHVMEASWALVRDAQGEPDRVLSIAADVTERRALEEQLLRAQRMESIGTLAGGIAHDLNNVLAPVLMAAEILRADERDPDQLDLLATIESSARRGADLVRQVLTFARGVSGERTAVDLAVTMRDAAHIVRDTFPKNIQIEVSAPNELWRIAADATQIHQVVMNLCVNARDAMPAGGRLRLMVENQVLDESYLRLHPLAKPGSYTVLTVVDSGLGMAPETRERLFEPFFTTKPSGAGTGLGLSTVHSIVRSHGGFVNVYSQPGKGSTFKVYLPAAADPLDSEKVAIEQSQLPRGQGELVLVVDDEEAIREVARRTLERFGYRALLAANGAQAVALYAQERTAIAVVLTDMSMPVLDGPATIVALRAIDPEVRIIGTSGLGSENELSRAVGAGVEQFVPKPYTADALLHALQQALR